MVGKHASFPDHCDDGYEGKPKDSREKINIETIEHDRQSKQVHMQRIATICPKTHRRPVRLDVFAGKRFIRTGDVGRFDEDGFIVLGDRKKDMINRGGYKIYTIEVENVLYSHPQVLECAVVAAPDERWGEVPCAFVELKPNSTLSAEEILAHCREHLARFKVPKAVVFGEIPKTSTGKLQKFVLRERLKAH